MFFISSLQLLLLASVVQSIIITTKNGQLEGATTTAKNGKIVHMFKHIPFAQPPLRNLRYAKPLPAMPWKGVRNAKVYGPACMSNSTTTSSPQKWVDEDCLHVNIFTSDECLKSTAKCSVAFYIHGGGINYDSAVMFKDYYLVNNFAAQDIVLVVTAFRLGFTSLLTFPNDNAVPRNLAAYDMILSLNWVQDNINNFGGDRKQVSLFGHSMGGTVVTMLTFSKTIDPERKLFQKAVSMSAPAYFADEFEMMGMTWEFAYRAECSPLQRPPSITDNYAKEVVECLRTKDATELLRVQYEMELDGMVPQGLVFSTPLFTGEDVNDFLTNPPSRSFLSGSITVEMDNYNSRDVPGQMIYIPAMLGAKHPIALGRKADYDRIQPNYNQAIFNHTVDTQIIFLSAWRTPHEMRKTGAITYLYQYTNPRHPEHTDDLSYIMGAHAFEHDETEAVLAKIYPLYFTNFIKAGIPDKNWKPLDDEDSYFNIDVNLKAKRMPFTDKYYEKDVISYWTKTMKAYDEKLTEEDRSQGIEWRAETLNSQPERCIIFYYSYWNYIILMVAASLIGLLIGRLTKSQQIIVLDSPNEYTPLYSTAFGYGKTT